MNWIFKLTISAYLLTAMSLGYGMFNNAHLNLANTSEAPHFTEHGWLPSGPKMNPVHKGYLISLSDIKKKLSRSPATEKKAPFPFQKYRCYINEVTRMRELIMRKYPDRLADQSELRVDMLHLIHQMLNVQEIISELINEKPKMGLLLQTQLNSELVYLTLVRGHMRRIGVEESDLPLDSFGRLVRMFRKEMIDQKISPLADALVSGLKTEIEFETIKLKHESDLWEEKLAIYNKKLLDQEKYEKDTEKICEKEKQRCITLAHQKASYPLSLKTHLLNELAPAEFGNERKVELEELKKELEMRRKELRISELERHQEELEELEKELKNELEIYQKELEKLEKELKKELETRRKELRIKELERHRKKLTMRWKKIEYLLQQQCKREQQGQLKQQHALRKKVGWWSFGIGSSALLALKIIQHTIWK